MSIRRDGLSPGERIAVQEALADVFQEDVKELKGALTILSDNVSELSGLMSNRIAAVEQNHANVKAFVAGIGFTFSLAGGAFAMLLDAGISYFKTRHGG